MVTNPIRQVRDSRTISGSAAVASAERYAGAERRSGRSRATSAGIGGIRPWKGKCGRIWSTGSLRGLAASGPDGKTMVQWEELRDPVCPPGPTPRAHRARSAVQAVWILQLENTTWDPLSSLNFIGFYDPNRHLIDLFGDRSGPLAARSV